MRYTRFIFVVLFIALAAPMGTQAQNAVNAGFVEGLWYSKEPVFSNESVRIYAALRNNTDSDLTGTVVFKDGNSVIAKKDISALSGRLIETWADWEPTYGEHTISATLTDIRLHRVGESPERVRVTSDLSERYVFIDRDTDGDGIGDKEDADDDNDGVSDEKEEEQGTDPLTPNVPPSEPDADDTSEEAIANEETENTDETDTVGNDTNDTNEKQEGFEGHFGGSVHTILSNVTERVNESKAALDAYRAERNAEKERAEEAEKATSSSVVATTSTTSPPSADATITRTQLESDSGGFMKTIIAGIVGIFDALYTLLLWIVSTVLGHPGLVQLLLLITILVSAYKLAKWYGARRQMQ